MKYVTDVESYDRRIQSAINIQSLSCTSEACADQGQRPGDKPAQGNALGKAWKQTQP